MMKYIVQPWDGRKDISMLASRFGVTAEEMLRANPVLQSVPVYPGMILDVPIRQDTTPPKEGYLAYVVQPDDTLYSISSRFKLNYHRVIAQNPQIENPNMIWPGQIIYLTYSGA